jgi:potassium efflux system protein
MPFSQHTTTRDGFIQFGRRRRSPRHLATILLGILTLLLVLTPVSSTAQAPIPERTAEAPVVVDGRVLFKVRNSGNFTAAERAAIINTALAQEARSLAPVEIDVVQDNQLTTIRSRTANNPDGIPTDRNLVTVTKEDVIPGISPFSQGIIWRRSIVNSLQQSRLERTSDYERQALIFSMGVLLGAIAIHLCLHVLGKLLSHQILRWFGAIPSPLHLRESPLKLFLQLALIGLQTGLWIAVAFYISDLFPVARHWRYQLFNFINSPIIGLGTTNYSALQLLLLFAFTIGLWFAVSALTKVFRFYVLVRTGADPGMQEVIAILAQYILTFLGLIVLLQIWGLDVGSLAILASVLGVGIGFGVQNITNNFISGLIITLERPIQVGDFVKVSELVGTVERIGARSTEIRTLDQVTIIVPNSRFLETEVINWSHGDPVSRLKIPVGVAYSSSVEQVQAALLEAARTHPDVLVKPQPQVWFQGFGDNSLNFELMVWTGEPKKQFRVRSDLYYRIEASLRQSGIEVPFPQRDLHVRSPELEKFFHTWFEHQAPIATDTPSTNGNNRSDRFPDSSLEPLPEQAVAAVLTDEKLIAVDLNALATAMRESGELEIKDRRYRFNLYPACFIGAEAVEWLVQQQNCTRQQAIQLGQLLIERGIIHHVWGDYPFRDDYSFYRCAGDEQVLLNSAQ